MDGASHILSYNLKVDDGVEMDTDFSGDCSDFFGAASDVLITETTLSVVEDLT